MATIKEILGDKYSAEIEKALNQYIGENFTTLSKYNERADELKEVKKTLGDYKTQLETLKTQAAGNAEMQADNAAD